MRVVAGVVLAVGLAHALAFRPELAGTNAFWWWLLLPYAGLAALAVRHFWKQGTLAERLTPRWGDLSIGVVTALVLLLASWLARGVLAPNGTPRRAWLYRVYLQLGDPEILQQSALLTAALLAIAAAEELVFRGLVLDLVTARFGPRRGFIVATLLYAAAMLPTVYLLRDPVAGPNPLLVTAALGAGLVWSFLAGRSGRLAPVALSHMAFSYFSVVQFRWPGM